MKRINSIADFNIVISRIDAVKRSRSARASEVARQAGLMNDGCQMHNYFVDCSYGRPWANIDYCLARKARKIAEGCHTEATRRLRDRAFTIALYRDPDCGFSSYADVASTAVGRAYLALSQ